jgi:phosphate transport system substrate-binding protein
MEEAGKEFMKKHPNVKVVVSGGGSGFGIKQVGEGYIDIGMAGRDLKPEEKEKYPNLKVYKIGVDGVAIVVNPKNPINGLTKEQVKKIFAGEITNWKEVGGKDAPINVYTRDPESGTRETFWKFALDKGNITKKAIVVASNGEMKTKIAMDENGIGYLSVGYVDGSVKAIKLDGIAPTQENVKKVLVMWV